MIFALGACAALGAARLRGEVGLDSWYSLVAGRLIARHGIPHHDSLTSLSLGRVWVDQQWLAHLALYGLWAAGGWAVALLSVVVIYTASFAVLAASARSLGASERSTAIVVVPCFLAGLSNTVYRAQIPSYLLFALVLGILLADTRRPSRRVYLVLPVLVLWANIHGSVVLGSALVGLAGVVFAIVALPVDGCIREPGCLVPHCSSPRRGSACWPPPTASRCPATTGACSETTSSSTPRASGRRARSVASRSSSRCCSAALLLAGAGRRALGAFASLALVLTAVMGLFAVRDIVWFAFTAAAVLPAALDSVWPPQSQERRPRLNLALVAVSSRWRSACRPLPCRNGKLVRPPVPERRARRGRGGSPQRPACPDLR